MSSVYLLGRCFFEMVAVKELVFLSTGITCRKFFNERELPTITSGNLIVCLSSEPLICWAKNLSLIKRLLKNHTCNITVLTPKYVPHHLIKHNRLNFMTGNTLKINIMLYVPFYNKVKAKYSKIFSLLLHYTPEECASVSGLNIKTVYYYRNCFMTSLGFSSFHHMSLCLVGCSKNIISAIYIDCFRSINTDVIGTPVNSCWHRARKHTPKSRDI